MIRSFLVLGTLLAVWAIILGASFLELEDASRSGFTPIRLRVASSAVLVAAAWVGRSTLRGGKDDRTSERTTALFVAVGMTLGFLGDSTALLPVESWGIHRLLPAMILFGLGHVAYMAGFLRARPRTSRRSARTWAVAIVLWLAVVAAGWLFAIGVSSAPAGMRGAALGYAVLLGGTGAVATGLACERRRFWPVVLGAALFAASDTMLAFESFRGSLPWTSDLTWATYGPAQMLITIGTIRGVGGHGRA